MRTRYTPPPLNTCCECGEVEDTPGVFSQPFEVRVPDGEGILFDPAMCDDCMTDRYWAWCIKCKNFTENTALDEHDWRYTVCLDCCEQDDETEYIVQCDSCDNTLRLWDTALFVRGDVLCHQCADTRRTQCAHQHCIANLNKDTASERGGYIYCNKDKSPCYKWGRVPAWFPTEYQTWEFIPTCSCPACNRLHKVDHTRWNRPDDYTIDPVLKTCASCQSEYATGGMTAITDDISVCHMCLWKFYHTCSGCDTWMIVNNTHILKLCQDCMAGNENFWHCSIQCNEWFPVGEECRCEGVYAWNYTPVPLFQHIEGHTFNADHHPYIGIELEVEGPSAGRGRRREGLDYLTSIMGDTCYPMHDGSLAESGFEIVSHPMSWEWFKDNFWKWETLLKGLRGLGYKCSDRCGMHVHLSRLPMTQLHQMKFIRFVYGSSNLALCIGQRGYTSLGVQRYASFNSEDRARFIDKVRGNRNAGITRHFAALNTMKGSSIEGRWFSGTLGPLTFRKNVEFMHSLFYFTRKYGLISSNEMNYIEWLRSPPERNEYAVLVDYIERNYVTRPWRGASKGRR